MKSLWNDTEALNCEGSDLALRVYTSRLLGREPSLVLHGGGNTSVKSKVRNLFGEVEDLLYIKGSGWDLATIEAEGFAPVKLEVLKRMATLEHLSDADMVRHQKAAMTNPSAPNPSVEAILHAIIPFKYVDHTHADATITISNTPSGQKRIEELYGPRVLVVPYVMPGFVLARKIYEMTQDVEWEQLDGIMLMNHGVFTFGNTAKESYENMTNFVTKAENYLKQHKAWSVHRNCIQENRPALQEIAKLRQEVSSLRGKATLLRLDPSNEAYGFSTHQNVDAIANRGPLTPDHVIRTKQLPIFIRNTISGSLNQYKNAYQHYFKQHSQKEHTCLDSAPRWGVWPNAGLLSFGSNAKELRIISDITKHTITAIQRAEALESWKALESQHIFDVEYWELEQAKLKKSSSAPEFEGQVVLVTGAASGIGRACVERFLAKGAAVAGLDIDTSIEHAFDTESFLGVHCDLTQEGHIKDAIQSVLYHFGGIDIVISNAGVFTKTQAIESLQASEWECSLNINLSSHQYLIKHCIPYLKVGINPTIIIVGSKNVPAPGPGASAYSVAKAGLNQLARVAALELAPAGIRVNTLHPNAVFDTKIWTPEVLRERAESYGLSVEKYKRNNLLSEEISSPDVAELATVVAGHAFSKTTGAQIPIDGGNERVI